MAIRIEIYHTIEDARDAWLAFQEKGDLYVFQTFEWLENWHHHVGSETGVEPCLVAVYDAEKPLYFFPFGIVRKGFVRALVWFGGEFGDYGSPIVARDRSQETNEAWSAPDFGSVWAEVLLRIPPVDVVWLVRIPERIDSRENPMRGLKCDPYHSGAYAARLSGTWNEFYASHAGAKTRSTDRRKSRRLSGIGAVTWTITDGSDEAALRRITHAMIEQKEKRYREIRARNLFHDDAHRDFFSRPLEGLVRSGLAHLSELSLNGEIITTHWGMVFRNRFYYFMPSFAPGPWTRFSPGRLLLFHLLEWCLDRGITVFDFTIGDEAYKTDWCDEETRLFQYFAARTAKGRLFGVLYRTYTMVVRNKVLLDAARRARRAFYTARNKIG